MNSTINNNGSDRSLNASNAIMMALILALASLIVRLVIWKTTGLIRFSEYELYLQAADRVIAGHQQMLQEGNMLFAISYIAAAIHRTFGSYEGFFILNSLLGALAGLLVYRLMVKATGNIRAGLITMAILLFYTEFQAFSAVFYTPVIMIFLVALLLNLFHEYAIRQGTLAVILTGIMLTTVYITTFFFKPELNYLPFFLIFPAIFLFAKDNHQPAIRITLLIPFLLLAGIAVNSPTVITKPVDNVISNSFVFFGHTDYGGDGGEGAFIYDYNRQRYEKALQIYLTERGIDVPSGEDYNNFQLLEVKKFIANHQFKWVALQFRKFFGTFGIVPESTSFRVLYTGLLSGKSWLAAFAVAAPVALILMLIVVTIRPASLSRAFGTGATGPILLTFMIYYLVATIFYGQYQERYRMTIMVLFIIPTLGYSLSGFKGAELRNRTSIIIRSIVLIIFITAWTFQAIKTVNNRERLANILNTTINS